MSYILSLSAPTASVDIPVLTCKLFSDFSAAVDISLNLSIATLSASETRLDIAPFITVKPSLVFSTSCPSFFNSDDVSDIAFFMRAWSVRNCARVTLCCSIFSVSSAYCFFCSSVPPSSICFFSLFCCFSRSDISLFTFFTCC